MDIEKYAEKRKKDENRIWKAFYIAVIIHFIFFLLQWNIFHTEALPETERPVIDISRLRFPPKQELEEKQIKREKTAYKIIPDPEPADLKIGYPEIDPNIWINHEEEEPIDYNFDDIKPSPIIYNEWDVLEKPVKTSGEEPLYPEIARLTRQTGIVVAQLTIGTDGRVIKVQILKSIRGNFEEHFNKAVMEAVSTYRYKPARHLDRNVAVKINVTFTFRLN